MAHSIAYSYKNLAIRGDGAEFMVERVSDGETMLFCDRRSDALRVMLEQNEGFYYAPKEYQDILILMLERGKVEEVYRELSAYE